MDVHESLSHTKWDCKYHVVFIPKCRRKTLYQQLRRHLGEVFRSLAQQKESRIEEGHLMPDHVHMMISIPPICGVPGSWLHQGQERDPFSAVVRREDTEFRRSTFLGPWILRLDRGAGRADDTRVHQEPRKGRSALGPAEYVALTATFRWPNA